MVDGNQLRLLATFRSAYTFAKTAVEMKWKLRDLLSTDLSGITLDYEKTHQLKTPWRFLASFDHFDEPSRCMVSASGASNEDWRYLGLGSTLKGHGDPIFVPPGELPEHPLGDVAAGYIIGPDGKPWRVGVSAGCSFSGTAFPVRSNVLGPELVLDPELASAEGLEMIYRNGSQSWQQTLSSRGAPILYALAALEPNHFRFADHHRPGDAHVLYIGAGLIGTRPAAKLQDGDRYEISWEGLGKPLMNPLVSLSQTEHPISSPL
jgi:hypothetical protein